MFPTASSVHVACAMSAVNEFELSKAVTGQLRHVGGNAPMKVRDMFSHVKAIGYSVAYLWFLGFLFELKIPGMVGQAKYRFEVFRGVGAIEYVRLSPSTEERHAVREDAKRKRRRIE